MNFNKITISKTFTKKEKNINKCWRNTHFEHDVDINVSGEELHVGVETHSVVDCQKKKKKNHNLVYSCYFLSCLPGYLRFLLSSHINH